MRGVSAHSKNSVWKVLKCTSDSCMLRERKGRRSHKVSSHPSHTSWNVQTILNQVPKRAAMSLWVLIHRSVITRWVVLKDYNKQTRWQRCERDVAIRRWCPSEECSGSSRKYKQSTRCRLQKDGGSDKSVLWFATIKTYVYREDEAETIEKNEKLTAFPLLIFDWSPSPSDYKMKKEISGPKTCLMCVQIKLKISHNRLPCCWWRRDLIIYRARWFVSFLVLFLSLTAAR